MKIIKKLLIALILIATMVTVSGCAIFDTGMSEKDMLKIVRSEEIQKQIEEQIKWEDSKALTEEGVIKSYRIDENSVKWNPMKAIMLDIIINDDREMEMGIIISGDNDGKPQISGSSRSLKLREELEKKYGKRR